MSKKLSVVNPYSEEKIGEVAVENWTKVDAYLEEAHTTFQNKKAWLPAYKRIEILQKTASLMQERFEDLAFLIANEGGKPLIDARIEVARAIDGVGLCIKELSNLTGKQVPMDLTAAGSGRVAFTKREPIGVVVAVSAFNHPLNLIVHQVAPAIAIGCPVIVKPADDTPLCCQEFVNMLYAAGLDECWCRMVMCDIPTAEKLVTDKRVAFFSFIGSAKVGWMLRSKLAPGTRCALEHGGVAPVIVEDSADIDSLIPSILKGGFYHSGQVCVSVQRVLASKLKAQQIAERLATEASKLVVGNAIYADTQCGPLIRPPEVTRVGNWIDEAQKEGATLLTGGKKLSNTSYQPTVLLNPKQDSKVSTMEIFGPLVCVYAYDSLDEAFAQANSLPFAFQASIFTNKLDIATTAINAFDATAVMVNDHTAFRVDWMPFAGRRLSGYGTGGIGYTMHDMSQDKMAVIKFK